MGFFQDRLKPKRLLAMYLANEGLYSACVDDTKAGLPILEFCSFHPKAERTWPNLLDRLLKESPAKKSQRSLLLAPGEYQILSVDALNVPAQELKGALRWRLKDLLDYPVDEASFDVVNIVGDKATGGRQLSLLAIVARNQHLRERQTLFDDAGGDLQVIDVPEMAQRNISALVEPESRGVAMLSFDENGGLLTVTFAGELYLARRLDVRLSQLDVDDAEKRVMLFERITLELQRSLDNFDRQHNFITTAKLVLAPLGQVAAELQSYLAANLYMPVEVLDLSDVLDLSKVSELKDARRQQMHFLTIGAALRREVNAT